MSVRSYFQYTSPKGRKYYYDTETQKTTFVFPNDGVIIDPDSGNVVHAPPNVKAVSEWKAPADQNSGSSASGVTISLTLTNVPPPSQQPQYAAQAPPPQAFSNVPFQQFANASPQQISSSSSADFSNAPPSQQPFMTGPPLDFTNAPPQPFSNFPPPEFPIGPPPPMSGGIQFSGQFSNFPSDSLPQFSNDPPPIARPISMSPYASFRPGVSPLLSEHGTGVPGWDPRGPIPPTGFNSNPYGTNQPRESGGYYDDEIAPTTRMAPGSKPRVGSLLPMAVLARGGGTEHGERDPIPGGPPPSLRFANGSAVNDSDQLIKRPLTVQAIVGLPLGLPPIFSRTKLLSVLSKFSLEDLAASAFRQHRSGLRFQKAFIPIENLLSFSTTPLKKPLLKSVPKRLKKTGAELFAKLLEYTDPGTASVHLQVLGRILEILKQNQTELVDEFFMQLVKQTVNNRRPNQLGRTWQLFLVISSIFPAGSLYQYILAHCARASTDPDQRIAAVGTFTFMRLLSRHYLNRVYEYTPAWLQKAPIAFMQGTNNFGCLIHECMWHQRNEYPKLPIPYVVHYIITLLKERGGLMRAGLFRTPAPEAAINDSLSAVNENVNTISRADIPTLAELLKIWLRELPDPLLPIEMRATFLEMAVNLKFLGFVEQMTQAYQLTLLYIIGFLQEVCKNGAQNGCNQAMIAAQFGPCIVNAERGEQMDTQKIERLNTTGTAFVNRLIEAKDTAIIYPIAQRYLVKGETKAPGRPTRGPRTGTAGFADAIALDYGDITLGDGETGRGWE